VIGTSRTFIRKTFHLQHTSKLKYDSYAFTYLFTTWSIVLLEKLTGSQLVKKFPAFYGTRRFRVYKRPPPVPILSQIYPFHSPPSQFLKIHINISFPSTPGSSKNRLCPIILLYSFGHEMRINFLVKLVHVTLWVEDCAEKNVPCRTEWMRFCFEIISVEVMQKKRFVQCFTFCLIWHVTPALSQSRRSSRHAVVHLFRTSA